MSLMSADKADRSHRDLFAAIGRVASASAELETTFRHILSDLANLDDIAWILFEGQSTDSLISSCRTVLWFAGDDTGWDSDHRIRLTKLLDECTQLRRGRNVVIHGIWSDRCGYEDYYEEDRECELRPPGSSKDDRIYFFRRSAPRMPIGDTHLAVNDIEALADKFKEMDLRIKALRREVVEGRRRRLGELRQEGE
jgi:hypothetical protein